MEKPRSGVKPDRRTLPNEVEPDGRTVPNGVRRTVPITPKEVFTIQWAPEGRDYGCVVRPEKEVGLYVGEIVQYKNTLDVEATLTGTCDDLFDEDLPLVISPGESVNLTRSAGAVSGHHYLCTVSCDDSGGGPRFVPQP